MMPFVFMKSVPNGFTAISIAVVLHTVVAFASDEKPYFVSFIL